MNTTRLIPIPLEFAPHPDGDNRIEVNILGTDIVATYISSGNAPGGARAISLVFTNLYAMRYFATEQHDELCPGLDDCESEFAVVIASAWLAQLPAYVQSMNHYVLGLNHCLFECIAKSYSVELG